MALRTLNFSDPLMKALKAVNSIGGKTLTEEDLKKQRSSMELAGKVASPASGITIDFKLLHPLKAESPIVCKFFERLIEDKLIAFLKAALPIDFTESGIVKESNL